MENATKTIMRQIVINNLVSDFISEIIRFIMYIAYYKLLCWIWKN